MSPETPDDDIGTFTAAHDWVILTSNDDVFEYADQCGALLYNQLGDPPPGAVLDAVIAIDDARPTALFVRWRGLRCSLRTGA